MHVRLFGSFCSRLSVFFGGNFCMSRFDYIRSDLFRYTGKTNLLSFFHLFLSNYGFRRQTFFRLVNRPKNGFWQRLYTITQGRIAIPYNTKVGYGLYIAHSGPVIINGTSIIGNNVNISQFLTIGSNYNSAAVIGDEVYIGPNVCIVENVKVGECSTIGAGSVVTKDVQADTTVAGNYAKIISNHSHPGFILNKWQY